MKTGISMVLILLSFVLPARGQMDGVQARHAVLKSTLIPGWGEHSLKSEHRGFVFNGIEAALWIFAGVAYSTANSHEDDLFHYAAVYGHIESPQKKSDVFLDRVSKYDSMEAYNAQMLRNRQWDRVYSAENGEFWEWGSRDERETYFDIKTKRYLWRQRLTYAFGAIALNHLVSTMDALYLKRLHHKLEVSPGLAPGEANLQLSIHF